MHQAKIDALNKGYHDHDWEHRYLSGKLRKLRVGEREKYINHHSLPKRRPKPEKLDVISAHIANACAK